ncbi:MAG: GH25 family lysozyme [Micromonosporaceae bacterium]
MAVAVLVIGGYATVGGLNVPHAEAASKVPGVDVSHHQGAIDWSALRGAGIRFAYLKATESTTFTDPRFGENYRNSHRAGVIRGAYHFARPAASSGEAQADYFVRHGGAWSADGMTLPGALDLEAGCHGLSHSAMRNWIHGFMKRYHEHTGRWAAIYTTTSWWTTCTGGFTGFGSRHPMWLARWNSSPGPMPAGWSTYSFWQYTDSGSLPGVSGNVDRNQFNGSYERLQVLARGSDKPDPKPTTDSPSPKPTRTESASAEPSPPDTTPVDSAPASEPPPGGGLPETGTNAGLVTGLGIALLLAGAGFLWFGRRRRLARHAAGRQI